MQAPPKTGAEQHEQARVDGGKHGQADRRRYPRMAVNQQQTGAVEAFRLDSAGGLVEPLPGTDLVDISMGGAGLAGCRPLPVGTPIQLQVHISGASETLTATGQVIRASSADSTTAAQAGYVYTFGVQFDPVSEKLAGRLLALLRRMGPAEPKQAVMKSVPAEAVTETAPQPQPADDGATPKTLEAAWVRRAEILELFDWFRGVDLQQRLRLAEVTEERSYQKGDAIVRQGDPGDGFYIIVSGSVNVVGSVESRQRPGVFTETIFATLPAGQAFGEMALLDGGARSATIVARVPTECLFIPREAFIETLQSNPATAVAIMAALSGRMRHADDRLSEVLQITEALTAELDLQKVYDATVRVVQETTEAGRISLQVLDDDKEQLVLVAGSGLPPGAKVGQSSPAGQGLAGWVLRELRPLILTGTSHPDPEIDRLMHDIPGMTAVCVPMLLKGTPVGVLNASSVPAGTESPDGQSLPVGKPLSQDEMTFLSVLAGQVAIAIEHARLYARTEAQATTDAITGLFNHRTFQTRLDEEVDRAKRSGGELGLLFVDVDSFKVINDTHGHPAGDQLLRVLAHEVLEAHLRQYDIIARYGGDEFAVILPNTDLQDSEMIAERLRAAAKSLDYSNHELPPDTGKIISLSIGLAHFPTDTTDRKVLLDTADRGVYFAKFLGKNQVQRGRAAGPGDTDDPTNLHEFLANADRGELEALAAAIDARDSFTAGHSRRVTEYVTWLAQALGHDTQFLDRLRLAALYHDVGKLAVPDGVLRKAGRLSDEEYERIWAHPMVGAEMLDQVPDLQDAIPAVRHHHERWDGSGYPDGLAGKDIPYTARLLAIADAYDAMTSDRLYRGALTGADIRRIFQSGAGIQWDPALVEVWCKMLDERSQNGVIPTA